ncbi:uncharacterized protein EI90DRAFT_3119640 [Cantharellus anzutake]|uniref:uncharacterized protein n=1 Tax=Cantharellus anzutake TaxID=1750568 RepID=UPI0019083E83|nr:uncharacterized protein EI90DRAFT_3119640 [Cantharellus anzutake]KAF8336353.1 hypothetical protein EI90DRAFT_3119640 [Cantharellus anzutake]
MPDPSVIHFLGSVIVAAAFDSVLFGVVTVQTATYIQRFRHDSWVYRFLVGINLVFIFDVTPSHRSSADFRIALPAAIFRSIHQGFSLNERIPFGWGFYAPGISTAFIPFLLHSYFIRLIHLVGQKRVLTILISIPVIAEFGCGVQVAQVLLRMPPTVLGQPGTGVRPYWGIFLYISLMVVCDISTTATLWIVLIRQKVGVRKADGPLVSLASGAALTGMITSLVSCAPLAGSIVARMDVVNIIGIMIGSIYAVALMINVHLRSRLRATSAILGPRSISVVVTREVAQELQSEGKHERTLRIRMTQLDAEYPATESPIYHLDNPAFEV